MSLTLICNPEPGRHIAYKIARVVYAETTGASLPMVEALTSMISNIHIKQQREFSDIINDSFIFNILDENHPDHELLNVSANSRAFQMCLRVAMRMLAGGLDDACNGATMFHHDDVIPDWATSRGYIAEVGDMLFYR